MKRECSFAAHRLCGGVRVWPKEAGLGRYYLRVKKMENGKLRELALKSKDVAYAIIGQAIIDEGDIGQTSVTVAYYSESMARYLWEIADRWGLANPLRHKRKMSGARGWSFTIKAHKRKELYDFIGPLPDKKKDFAFNHLLIPQPSGKHKYRRKKKKKKKKLKIEQKKKKKNRKTGNMH